MDYLFEELGPNPSQSGSSEPCLPSPIMQKTLAMSKFLDNFFTQVLSTKDEVKSSLFEYYGHCRTQLFEDQSRVIKITQLMEELNQEREEKTNLAIRVSRLEEELKVAKQDLNSQEADLVALEKRRCDLIVDDKVRSAEMESILAENKKLSKDLTHTISELVVFQEAAIRGSTQVEEYPVQLLERNLLTQESTTGVEEAFIFGRLHGRNEAFRMLMGANVVSDRDIVKALKVPPYHPSLRYLHDLTLFSMGECAVSREYERRGVVIENCTSSVPWMPPLFTVGRTL